jgi:hypothetical protein
MTNEANAGLLTTPPEGAVPPPATDASTAPTTAPEPSWRDSFTNAEYKNDPSLLKFKSIDDLAQSYKHLERSFGSNKISIPSEHATDDDWKQVFRKLGNPEKLEDYKLKAVEGVDETFIKGFVENAHKNGILPKQAEQLLGWYKEAMSEQAKAAEQQTQHQTQQVINELKQEWGKAFNDKILRAQSAVREFGGEELVNFLNESGLGNNPVLVKLFAKLGDLTKEDSVPGRESSRTVMTPSEAIEKARVIMNDKEHPFNIPNHPNHQKALAEMQRIYELAYPEQDG